MNVPQTDLNACRVLVARLKQIIWATGRADPKDASSMLEEAGQLTTDLDMYLDHAGAEAPQEAPAPR